MGPHKVGGAEPRGLWYVTIRSVPVSQLHNSTAAHWRKAKIINSQSFSWIHMNILIFFVWSHASATVKFTTLIMLCTTTPHLKMYHWLASGNFPLQLQPVIFDCFLGLESFPTSPPEEDNALLWDWCELATAAGSRDRSVQIQWSLCHVCQQSHRLNKPAKLLPAKCPADFKRVLDWQCVCMFTVLWLSPLRALDQFVASKERKMRPRRSEREGDIMSYEFKQDCKKRKQLGS